MAVSVAAPDEMSAETSARVKRATVHLYIGHHLHSIAFVSGVVVGSANDVVYVVSNQRPTVTKVKPPSPIPIGPFAGANAGRGFPPGFPGASGAPRAGEAGIWVTFDGTTTVERTLKGELVASDAESDLALIRVRGESFVRPIDLAPPKPVVETTEVFSVGISYDHSQGLPKTGRAATVEKRAVTSLQMGADGDVARLHLKKADNNVLSGGPVVDANGRVVGVLSDEAYEAFGGTIGLAIARDRVIQFLGARARDVQVRALQTVGELQLSLSAEVIDPLGQVKAATLYCLPADRWTDPEDPRHPLDNHPDAKRFNVLLSGGRAVAQAAFAANTGPMLIQLVLESRDPNASYVKVVHWPASTKPVVDSDATEARSTRQEGPDSPMGAVGNKGAETKTEEAKSDTSKPRSKTSRSSRPTGIGSRAQLEKAIKDAQQKIDRARNDAKSKNGTKE